MLYSAIYNKHSCEGINEFLGVERDINLLPAIRQLTGETKIRKKLQLENAYELQPKEVLNRKNAAVHKLTLNIPAPAFHNVKRKRWENF